MSITIPSVVSEPLRQGLPGQRGASQRQGWLLGAGRGGGASPSSQYYVHRVNGLSAEMHPPASPKRRYSQGVAVPHTPSP